MDPNYKQRTENIYTPKVNFLLDNLPETSFSVFDIGCGAGYFVAGCLSRGMRASGIDVSEHMVSFGNQQISLLTGNINLLEAVSENDFFSKVEKTDSKVVSAIGVIEHLRDPQKLFDAFGRSHAEYLYYSVPMFSMSVMLENILPEVFPRQLSAGHTHLFTESSIQYMHDLMRSNSIAEWRFGTDIMDLYRFLVVMMKKNGASEKMLKLSSEGIVPLIDKLQSVLDESEFCSEIHCLVKKV